MNEQVSESALAPQEQRTGMMLAHLFGLLFGALGALIYWLINKDKSETPWIQDQAKEVLNFELNVLVLVMVSYLLIWIVIGLFLLALVAVAAFVLTIMGAIKAYNGELYRYPFIIRLIK